MGAPARFRRLRPDVSAGAQASGRAPAADLYATRHLLPHRPAGGVELRRRRDLADGFRPDRDRGQEPVGSLPGRRLRQHRATAGRHPGVLLQLPRPGCEDTRGSSALAAARRLTRIMRSKFAAILLLALPPLAARPVAVVVDPRAPEIERYAAAQLCDYLRKLFGIETQP